MPDKASNGHDTVAVIATQLIGLVGWLKLPSLLLLSANCVISLVGCLPKGE